MIASWKDELLDGRTLGDGMRLRETVPYFYSTSKASPDPTLLTGFLKVKTSPRILQSRSIREIFLDNNNDSDGKYLLGLTRVRAVPSTLWLLTHLGSNSYKLGNGGVCPVCTRMKINGTWNSASVSKEVGLWENPRAHSPLNGDSLSKPQFPCGNVGPMFPPLLSASNPRSGEVGNDIDLQ